LSGQESDPLVKHPALGYKIRKGGWVDQQLSTYRLAEQKLAEACYAEAERLGRYTIREALEGYELYSAWIEEIPQYLRTKGVTDVVIDSELARIEPLLRWPDGRDFDPKEGWQQYQDLIHQFAQACRETNREAANELLERARQTWRVTHDRVHDKICFLLTLAARELGESEIGPLWDCLMEEMYRSYDRYDVDHTPWEQSAELLMHIMAEALRGHLSGPGRRGDIEFVDEGHRIGFRFDPCGSGGRTYRADLDEGIGPRMLPPYDFGVTQEPHDWAWNEKGICYYCAHCCQLMERIPIKKYGYPARVTEPPKWPDAETGTKCTWWVYRDPRDVPEEIYRRVGATKPSEIGGTATRAREQGKITES